MGHHKESCDSGAFFSLLAGMAFGGILGLLFAPVEGKEARDTIHEKYDELKGKLKKLEDKFSKHEAETPDA